jgi:hypothetical protein
MLAYFLAIAVALSSLSLFGLAFFSPDLHRRDDFLWSGVGLFYALVLWVCAGRISGGLLLGQIAAASLIFALGWQTWKLRQAIAYPEQNHLEEASLLTWLQKSFGPVASLSQPRVVAKPQPPVPAAETVEFEEFELETNDEDVTETSEIKGEATNPNKVVVGIYEAQDTLPTEPFPVAEGEHTPENPEP